MSQEMKAAKLATELAYFTGSTEFYAHGLIGGVIYSQGVQHLAEEAGAYWLIDAIASHLAAAKVDPRSELAAGMQDDPSLRDLVFWKLELVDGGALLTARADSDREPVVRQEIPWTDFPLDSIDIWTGYDGVRWTLCLPSEH